MKRIMLVFVVLVLGFLVACETITPTVTITYETNGGTLGTDAITEIDKGMAISEPTVTKEGYTLSGWYSDSTYNVAYDFAQGVEGDIKIYAKWQPIELIVTYYTDSEYDTITTTYGESFPTTDDPVVEGYHFDGWYSDQELTSLFDVTTAIVEDNMTLYGKFTIEEYTLTIVNMGNVVSEITYEYGEVVTIPSSFEMDGYVFNGVFEEITFENEVMTGYTMPAEDTTLYIEMIEPTNTLTIYLVPFRASADEMLDMASDLGIMMLDYLDANGSVYTNVEFKVGVSFEAVGYALLDGTADLAFMPAGTYVQYKDMASSPIEPLVAVTRIGLTKDFDDAILWNDGFATNMDPENQVPYYRGLIIAGPSTAGQAVAAKVNSGTPLVWDDLKDLNWCVRSATSSSGFIYPNLWLDTKFDRTTDDITGSVTTTPGYGDSMSSLANETCDVGTFYADARMTHESDWMDDYGRTQSIWTETNVIGVSVPIMNDLLAYNSTSLDTVTVQLLIDFFTTVSDNPGYDQFQELFYNEDFIVIDDESYDNTRAAMDFLWQ